MAVSRESKSSSDGRREFRPAALFFFELPAARGSNGIEPCFAPGLGDAPLRTQPFVISHAVQSRVERSFPDSEAFVRGLLNTLGDGIAVQRSGTREDLQNQEVEGSLETVVGAFRSSGSYV